MTPNKLLIKNCNIVSSERTFFSDILIEDGKIINIANSIENIDDCEQIDAKKQYVFSGGIDPHVHMHLPTPAGYSSDDFFTGSKAALFGGTTTIIDFVTPQKKQSLVEALSERKKEAENSLTDYSFHVSPIDWHEGIEDEILQLIKQGINSFKVYMAYSIGLKDDVLLKVMKVIAEAGALLTVHAEIGDTIEDLRNSFAKQGKLLPEYHALSRPNYTEGDAVKKIIEFSEQTNCPVYIVHVSAKESVEHIKNAHKRGLKIYGETCPQYLLLTDEKLKGDFKETAKYIFSPVIRKKDDNNKLWQGIKDNTISTIGTDHCPFTFEQKKQGINDFRKIPNGAGGVEHRMSLLYTYGVLKGKISINEFVSLSSTNSSKIFGLYPKKGEIAVGSDADLIIWKSDINEIISVKTHHQNCDLNIYEGVQIKGKPEIVIKSGKVIIENNEILNQEIKGKYLKRKL